MAVMNGPLTGVRVLEAANWLAVPAVGALLADLGAEIIKVEPPAGDAWRNFRLESAGFDGPFAENYAFQVDNRGKRSITLDLTTTEGRGVALRLAERSDIFLTNLLPRRLDKYGLSYQELSRRNPRLIALYLSGYGDRGPDQDRPGFDYAAFWVRSGIMSLLGQGKGEPIMQRPGMGDHTACWVALSGVLAALYERERTGRGQRIAATLMGTGIWVIGSDVQATLVTRKNPARRTRVDVPNPLWNTYQGQDGCWFMLVMPQPDPYWPALCRAIDREDLREHPHFATFEARAQCNRELITVLDDVFRTATREEWGKRFDREGIIWAPAQELTDVINDPQTREMNLFVTLDHPNLGSIETIQTPLSFSKSRVGARGPAPELGQHTEEVLLDLGYTWENIAQLRDRGVL